METWREDKTSEGRQAKWQTMKWQMSNIAGVETETNNCREKRSNSTWHLSALLLCWSYVSFIHCSFSYLSFVWAHTKMIKFSCHRFEKREIFMWRNAWAHCYNIQPNLLLNRRVFGNEVTSVSECLMKKFNLCLFLHAFKRRLFDLNGTSGRKVGWNHLNQLDTHTQC